MQESLSLAQRADYIRKNVVEVSMRNGAGHIAPSLSCVDILVALYYRVMRYHPNDTRWDGRDRLVFSKSHGCYALYAILADLGALPKYEWEEFYTKKSTLLGCMERRLEYGLEAGCGALGHGLPIATGMAYGAKLQNKDYHVFCLVGDGEMQEGSFWEAAQFAVKHGLDNLTIVVDANGLQAMDFLTGVLDREENQLVQRLRGFGFTPLLCPGHDAEMLAEQLDGLRTRKSGLPAALVADTTKGYGVRCMEDIAKFHFRLPTSDELAKGCRYDC